MEFFLNKSEREKFPEWLDAARIDGALALIDKKPGWTSFDVVAKLRNAVKVKKTGHAGTLDPLASGLLILGFGSATKKLAELSSTDKEYEAVIKLGATTKTDDAEADEENIKEIKHLSEEDINNAALSFLGKIEQVPPMFSAKKVGGKRLYKLARQDKEIELKPSSVEILKIYNLAVNMPFLHLSVLCSKGTYIRSLARDVGLKLGCGAYLHQLRRTAVGEHRVKDALTIDEFLELIRKYAI